MPEQLREIPYNYTSFSDREIVCTLLNESVWTLIESLREQRRTGRSARMIYEVLGDLWVVQRNPYLQDDLIRNRKRRQALLQAMQHRLDQVQGWATSNTQAQHLVAQVRQRVQQFVADCQQQASMRKKTRKCLGRITREDNIDFSGLARVSQATDATDWRVAMPFVVLTPDTEAEVAPLVTACIDLGLSLVPRGGGTGYTGGAVPLDPWSAVLNTEKLDQLSAIVEEELPEGGGRAAVITAGAGVITKQVSLAAMQQKLVFAVDPTSQDACTIGGNVAMNAGGKKAVVWGTTLDNLLSWRMVTPQGDWLEIIRLNHNQDKIHVQDTVRFRIQRYAADGHTAQGASRVLSMAGASFRKQGLGKDVTDKFLSGLPGIQKEGCDGLITSARFILHRMPTVQHTVCLEFYGDDLRPAVEAIVTIMDQVERRSGVRILGLEHLDERYLKAVNYARKADHSERLRMLLVADIGGEHADQVAACCSEVVRLANACHGEGFIAVSAEARQQFWEERSRTAAIATHTNAFKINEDVVIPLANLGRYSEGVEAINIEYSLRNKIAILQAQMDALADDDALCHQVPRLQQNDELAEQKRARIERAKCLLRDEHAVLNQLLNQLATPWQQLAETLPGWQPQGTVHAGDTLLDLMRRHALVVSLRRRVAEPLRRLFSGDGLETIWQQLQEIHRNQRSARLFVALHMHAGDGNVHTNIPVHSDNYRMLYEAEQIVARIMDLAQELDGVISGEHGIGLTKIQYLPLAQRSAFEAYKKQVDPQQHFNRGKLMPGSGLDQAYTPSLRLLEQEALILEASALGDLNDQIRHCLRCGKCKPECMTHIPRANLLYSPRNKILGTGQMIEAFLYEEQTRRGVSVHHFAELADIADHCTTCHKCQPPCPVDIDFGEVSIAMRKLLKQHGQRSFRPGTMAALWFLNARDPYTIGIMRKLMLDWGGHAHRLAARLARWLGVGDEAKRLPRASTGKTPVTEQVLNFVRTPVRAKLAKKTTRALLGLRDARMIPILRDPQVAADAEAVFYFPGCGSERMFSEVGLATLSMLYHAGVQTVLPPGYLCCGYPQKAAGQAEKGQQIATDNRVLFHRVANTLNYLDIKTVIVSCGTCMDQLQEYAFERIFPGCRLLDIHEFMMEKGVRLDDVKGQHYIYHDPCHSPMKTHDPMTVAKNLLNSPVDKSTRCCGEAGTLAVSRPDIAAQLRYQKREVLQQGLKQAQTTSPGAEVKLLTSCPACQQGLARYEPDTGLQAEYIVVEMVRKLHGENWAEDFVARSKQGGLEQILL